MFSPSTKNKITALSFAILPVLITGVLAHSANIGQCVAGCRIDQIRTGDEILTLDENTGKLVVARVNGLMEFGNEKAPRGARKSRLAPALPILSQVYPFAKGSHPYLAKSSAINTASPTNAGDMEDIVLAEKFNSQAANAETMSGGRQINQGFGKDHRIRSGEIKSDFAFNALGKAAGQLGQISASLIAEDERMFHKEEAALALPFRASDKACSYSAFIVARNSSENGQCSSSESINFPKETDSYFSSGNSLNIFSSIRQINSQKAGKSNKNQDGRLCRSYPTTARHDLGNDLGANLEKCLSLGAEGVNLAEDFTLDINNKINNSSDDYSNDKVDLSNESRNDIWQKPDGPRLFIRAKAMKSRRQMMICT